MQPIVVIVDTLLAGAGALARLAAVHVHAVAIVSQEPPRGQTGQAGAARDKHRRGHQVVDTLGAWGGALLTTDGFQQNCGDKYS